ncbi:MAG: PD40 domain-containing protein [Chitinispirillaceae bacterium]|nr:PD40 domain-containing protein [Chitinispirillaceae bacterium]
MLYRQAFLLFIKAHATMKASTILSALLVIGTAAGINGQAVDKDWFIDLLGENSGHTTCAFLTLPVSAGGLGLGNAASVGMFDATDIHTFTAATSLSDKSQFALTHCEWHMGLRNEFAGATVPFVGYGTLGLFSQMFTAGSDRYAFNIDEQPSDFSLIEFAAGASFARSFLDRRINAGASLYYVESRLDYEAGRALATSADVLFCPLDWLSGTVQVRHLGSAVTYNAGSEPLPLQTGASIQVYPLRDFHPEYGIANTLSLGTGVQKTADEPLTSALCIEWRPLRYLCVRSGYEYPLGTGFSVAGLSAGIGFKSGTYSIDGAWKYQSRLFGPIWAATCGLEVDALAPRTAEEYETLAQERFGKGQYKECIAYARKALRRNPNLWKAQTLITKARSEILRRKKREIAIIYSGNLRGVFLPPPHAHALGGLSRQATVINALRAQYPVSVSLAAGNVVTARSHELKAKIAHRYYRYIKHDAAGLGQGEFDYDIGLFLEADSAHVPFVCLGGERLGYKKVTFREKIEKSKYAMVVLSAANTPEIADALAKARTSLAEELRLELKRHDARTSNLRIVVLHDSWENIKGYAGSLAGADIVVCGSLAQRFETPMKIGNTLVVSAGAHGEFVGCLTLRFDHRKRLLSYDNRLYPVAENVPEDKTVKEMVAPITADQDRSDTGRIKYEAKKSSTQGVFPFVSDRDGTPDLYLKMVDQLTEFPLTSSGLVCGTPAVSFDAGAMAYMERDTSYGCRPLYSTDLTGERRRVLADSVSVYEARFSPDGSWLYYAASGCGDTVTDLYRVRPDSGALFPVVEWENSTERSIAFSPDFREMVFCSNRDRSWQLYLSDSAGTHPLRLTDESCNHLQPRFSPDGVFISYLSDRNRTDGGADLWLFDRAKGMHRPLTTGEFINSYCWLPDARRLIVSAGLDLPELLVVRRDTTAPARFFQAPDSTQKLYGESDPQVIWYRDKVKVLYVRTYDRNRRHLYWADENGANDRPVVSGKGNHWLVE